MWIIVLQTIEELFGTGDVEKLKLKSHTLQLQKENLEVPTRVDTVYRKVIKTICLQKLLVRYNREAVGR